MKDYNLVESEYKNKAVVQGDILIFNKNVAIDFIKRCQQLEYKLFGIDGFYLDGNKTQPSMVDSIEFYEKEGFFQYSNAIDFIESRSSKELFYEIICSST